MASAYDDVLADMVAAARAAGVVTQRHFRRREIAIGTKGLADFVSDADREAELLIRDRLLGRYPDWSLSGEEFPPEERGGTHCWLVDPIDGTTNFLNGMDHTVSIALRRSAETVAGVLLNPVRGETFTAIRGGGAFLTASASG